MALSLVCVSVSVGGICLIFGFVGVLCSPCVCAGFLFDQGLGAPTVAVHGGFFSYQANDTNYNECQCKAQAGVLLLLGAGVTRQR